MQGKVRIWSGSMRVHKATWEQLMRYPLRELREYAKSIGVDVNPKKAALVTALVASGRATICGGLGN